MIMHKVTAVSNHERCYSKNVLALSGVGCTCKVDTVETVVVGTADYRNWQFPKDKNLLVIDQVLSEEELLAIVSTAIESRT